MDLLSKKGDKGQVLQLTKQLEAAQVLLQERSSHDADLHQMVEESTKNIARLQK